MAERRWPVKWALAAGQSSSALAAAVEGTCRALVVGRLLDDSSYRAVVEAMAIEREKELGAG